MLPRISALLSGLLSLEVSIHYQRGWCESQELGQALRENIQRDQARGHTTVGPHRADLAFRVDGTAAQQRLSRGEAKLFCIGAWLAQAEDYHTFAGRMPLILIDDLAAELDEDNRRRAFARIDRLGAQTFVTAVSEAVVSDLDSDRKSFHVERGKVAEMV